MHLRGHEGQAVDYTDRFVLCVSVSVNGGGGGGVRIATVEVKRQLGGAKKDRRHKRESLILWRFRN